MEPPTDPWTALGLVLGGVMTATLIYFRTNAKGSSDAQKATMGLFMDREVVVELNRNVERIADACESLADKKQDAMSGNIEKMLTLLTEREKAARRRQSD